MIGLVFLGLTVVAVLAVLLPLARRRAAPEGGQAAVYRDQLAEIDRDKARGAIGDAEAEAARVEVARRLITASEEQPVAVSASRTSRRAVALLALIGLPLIAGGIYLALGHRGMPDLPLAGRQATPENQLADLVMKVEAALAQRPEDGQGWDVIAPAYLGTGQAGKAAEAYANAIRLLGSTAKRESGHGEALVLAGEGKVSAEARAAFERAKALEPSQPRANFYLGRAAEQDGNSAAASDIYRQLLKAAPLDAPYISAVREALARVALGTEGQGPAVDPAALEGVSPDQRLATIRGMVEGLVSRLKDQPKDLGGRLRLIRAWTMLGEQDKAKAAATEARETLADDPAALRRISDLLLALGLEDKPA